MSYTCNASLSAKTKFTIDKRVTAICKLDQSTIKKVKSIVTFSISVQTADCRFLLLGAATRLRDNDSAFECFTIECFTLWAETPIYLWE